MASSQARIGMSKKSSFSCFIQQNSIKNVLLKKIELLAYFFYKMHAMQIGSTFFFSKTYISGFNFSR